MLVVLRLRLGDYWIVMKSSTSSAHERVFVVITKSIKVVIDGLLKPLSESFFASIFRLMVTAFIALLTLVSAVLMYGHQQAPLSLMMFILACTIMGSYFINQHHRLVPILLIVSGAAITMTTFIVIADS